MTMPTAAEPADHSDSDFLAAVSHALRTPLHGILGLTSLARTELPRSAALVATHHRLELVLEAAMHLQRMVNDLLDLSLMRSGGLQLRPVPFDLIHAVECVASGFQMRAPEVGIGFDIEIGGDVQSSRVGDQARVSQVLHNLLDNAFKFTPLGGHVLLEVSRGPGELVRFTVSDTGAGVAHEDRDRIFESAVRANNAPARASAAGLGLAVGRQLAREMHGDLVCGDPAHAGASFVFTAGLPVQEAPTCAPVPAPLQRAAAITNRFAGRTIFVAEDDERSGLVVGAVVRRLGCGLRTFSNTTDLLDGLAAAAAMPDAIVLEWDLPRTGGRAAAMAIRQHERDYGLPATPLIAMCTSMSIDNCDRAARAGITVLLPKPCLPDDLAAVIVEQLTRRHDDASARPLTPPRSPEARSSSA